MTARSSCSFIGAECCASGAGAVGCSEGSCSRGEERKMRNWGYSINSRPEWQLGSIFVEERPWWLSLSEWFAFWIAWEWLFKVELPDWPQIAWRGSDIACSPREWWGSVGNLVNAYVTNPLFQWVCSHPKNRRKEISIGYERVKEIFFADNPEFFEATEAKQGDAMWDPTKAQQVLERYASSLYQDAQNLMDNLVAYSASEADFRAGLETLANFDAEASEDGMVALVMQGRR